MKKLKHFDVYAQKKFAHSDALEHFQQESDLSTLCLLNGGIWQIGFCNRIVADGQIIHFSRQPFIQDASPWETKLLRPV